MKGLVYLGSELTGVTKQELKRAASAALLVSIDIMRFALCRFNVRCNVWLPCLLVKL